MFHNPMGRHDLLQGELYLFFYFSGSYVGLGILTMIFRGFLQSVQAMQG
jgi:hypothetical protein